MLSEPRLKTLRIILENQVVRQDDGVLCLLARGPLKPGAAKSAENLIRYRFATQLHGGRIRATVKGQHAEHEQLYKDYVAKRDKYLRGTARQRSKKQYEVPHKKALAKLRAYEAAHLEFPPKPA